MTYDALRNAVFKVNTALGSGSGFYLKDRDVLVTNFHVIEGCRNVAVEDREMNRFRGRVVFGNPETDLAFIKADGKSFTDSVSLNQVREVENRDKVWVIGYPFGMPYTETEGIVSNSNQLMEGRYFIQIDAAVNPGNSGGPVVDKDGLLVGVTTAKFTNAENMGFAIPARTVLEELESLNDNPELHYAIKCNSCKQLVFEKTDYCPNCGAFIDENLFEEKAPDDFGRFVEDALELLGMDAVLARTGFDYWQFHQGSSQVRIFVFDQNYLYAASPLNELPSHNLENLYRFLLEDSVPPYRLGVYNNQIYLSYRMHLSDIYSPKRSELLDRLAGMPRKADELDDFFVSEYQCEKTGFSKNA